MGKPDDIPHLTDFGWVRVPRRDHERLFGLPLKAEDMLKTHPEINRLARQHWESAGRINYWPVVFPNG